MFRLNDNLAGYTDDYDTAAIDAGFLADILKKHKNIFGDPGELKVSKLPPLHIETEPNKVVQRRAYRAPLAKRAEIDSEIDKMLALSIIRPSKSNFSSPICLAGKRDGTVRFVQTFVHQTPSLYQIGTPYP